MNIVKTVFLNLSLLGVIAIVALAQVLFATLVFGAETGGAWVLGLTGVRK